MNKGMHDGSITNAPKGEPRWAKTNAFATISEMSVDAPSSDNVVKLLVKEDVQQLINLYYTVD